MPIYEYECQTCSVHFERKQSVTEDPVQVCPECGGKVRKLFFPVGIIFKGSGWYKTDHGSGAIPPSEKAEAAPSAAKSAPAPSEPAKTGAAKSESSKDDSAKGEPKKTESKSNK